MRENKRIYIATPSYTGHREDFERVCFNKMCDFPSDIYEIVKNVIFPGGSLISGIRRYFMREFFKTNATHLLFIDADIAILEPDTLEKLALHDKDIVSTVFTTKTLPLGLVYSPYHGDEADLKHLESGKLFTVDTVGMGCMLIERHCLQRIEKYAHSRNQMCFQPMMYNGEYEGEDGAFCRRAGQLGYKIWVDPSIIIGHCGIYPFCKLDYIEYFKTSKHGIMKK